MQILITYIQKLNEKQVLPEKYKIIKELKAFYFTNDLNGDNKNY